MVKELFTENLTIEWKFRKETRRFHFDNRRVGSSKMLHFNNVLTAWTNVKTFVRFVLTVS